ncbi:MAG: MYXO-CTERM sorting domain-containing protein [Myxococcota bacterium]|nr:MYXO-CTERM sorting domain-containing protein [Myxococcota bacterium]
MRLVALGLLLVPALASADVIDDDWEPPDCEPLECPGGSQPVSLSHSGCASTCAPNEECSAASDCVARYGEGATCQPTRFCVGVRYAGHGMSRAVFDTCEPTGPCGGGAEVPEGQEPPRCEEVSRCIPADAPAPPPGAATGSGGCAGCTVAASPRPTSALAFALLALLALSRRRPPRGR